MADSPNKQQYKFTCTLPNGIHARPANCLEKVVSGFTSTVSVRNLGNEKNANARSVLSLVGADIKQGDQCLVTIQGPDCDAAYDEIVRFLEHEFPTCDDKLPEQTAHLKPGYIPPVLKAAGVKVLFGTPAAPGFGRGKLVFESGLTVPEDIVSKKPVDIDAELKKITSAMDKQRKEIIAKLETGRLSAMESSVLKAHLAIVRDVELLEQIQNAIKNENICAGKAVIKAFEHFKSILKSAQSELIRERILDVQDVCSQLLTLLYGSKAQPGIKLTAASVVVAESLTPSQFIAMDKSKLAGLVLINGGSTSHTVILARSFGIPCITSLREAESLLLPNSEIIIDAYFGIVLPKINEKVERFYAMQQKRRQLQDKRKKAFLHKPAAMINGRIIKVKANITTAEEAITAMENGADGIGLFRTEMLYVDREQPPTEQQQYEEYKKVSQAAGGKSVTIRTFDVGGDKPVPYLVQSSREDNPFLGYRGVRLYEEFEELFKQQLRAILRASEHGDFKILIPMVSSLEQVHHARAVLKKAMDELRAESVKFDPDIQLGIMMEVPVAVYIIPQLAPAVDFVSIGTNDLAQYLFAADRMNERVEKFRQLRHPGFLAVIKQICDLAHADDLTVSMCGEMAAAAENIPLLLGAGLDEISVSVPFVLDVKAGCATCRPQSCRELLGQALKCETAQQVDIAQANHMALAGSKPVISAELIDLQADCVNKEEAIYHACQLLFMDDRTANVSAVEQDLWAREEVYSTGLGFGFAIPHCKTRHIYNNSICVFRLNNPVDWTSLDDEPVDVVIAMAIRDAQDNEDAHMKIFSRLARSIMDEQFRQTVRTMQSPDELAEFLSDTLFERTAV